MVITGAALRYVRKEKPAAASSPPKVVLRRGGKILKVIREGNKSEKVL